MHNTQRYSNNNISYSRVKTAILITIFLALVVSLGRNIQAYLYGNRKIAETKATLEKIEAENKDLKAKKEEVSSGYFKEKQARDKLGYSKPDELVVILPDDEALRRLAPKPKEYDDNVVFEKNYKKWLKLFF